MSRPGLSVPKRVGVAAVAAVVVAELAVWALRPRTETPPPPPVAEEDYFSPAELQRAHDYRDLGRGLMILGLVVEGGVLIALVAGRPRFVRRGLQALSGRPLVAGAVAGAATSLALTVAALPLSVIAHERAVDVGLSTQEFSGWIADQGKSAVITTSIAAVGGLLLLALIRRFPRGWWVGGTGVVIAYSVGIVGVAPVLLQPLFNDFEPLEPGPVRASVLELGERTGVDIGEVYRVDASRRSTALNAYVSGLGPTKRVVIYDNLINGVGQAELASVVAHELGHQHNEDLYRGLAYLAIVAPLGMLFVRELGTVLASRQGLDPAAPAALPGYVLAMALAVAVLGVPGNQLSREIEAAADDFALDVTGDPEALVGLQTRLAERNLGDPDPPDWYQALFATHPSTVERIGSALAYEAVSPPRPPTPEGS